MAVLPNWQLLLDLLSLTALAMAIEHLETLLTYAYGVILTPFCVHFKPFWASGTPILGSWGTPILGYPPSTDPRPAGRGSIFAIFLTPLIGDFSIHLFSPFWHFLTPPPNLVRGFSIFFVFRFFDFSNVSYSNLHRFWTVFGGFFRGRRRFLAPSPRISGGFLATPDFALSRPGSKKGVTPGPDEGPTRATAARVAPARARVLRSPIKEAKKVSPNDQKIRHQKSAIF